LTERASDAAGVRADGNSPYIKLLSSVVINACFLFSYSTATMPYRRRTRRKRSRWV